MNSYQIEIIRWCSVQNEPTFRKIYLYVKYYGSIIFFRDENYPIVLTTILLHALIFCSNSYTINPSSYIKIKIS